VGRRQAASRHLGELLLLNGTLAHLGKVRGALIEREDQPHLIDGIDRVLRRPGGTARCWRFDRTSAVCDPKTGKLLPSFAAVAQHYGVGVAICPRTAATARGSWRSASYPLAQPSATTNIAACAPRTPHFV
jgi:hypothetical protein